MFTTEWLLKLIQLIQTLCISLHFNYSTGCQLKRMWLELETNKETQKKLFTIAGCTLKARWSCTSFFEPESAMKSTQHNGKHSLRDKDFPNTKL